MSGLIGTRKMLTVKCVFKAVRMMKAKSRWLRVKFDIRKFEEDFLNCTGYSADDLNDL